LDTRIQYISASRNRFDADALEESVKAYLFVFLLSCGFAFSQVTLTDSQLRAAADYARSKAGLSLVIWQNGHVLLEEGQNGGSVHQYYELASGTKSFSGVIAAAAVADGFLKFDELASDTLTEWKSDARRSRITVRMLLHLTSGLAPFGSAQSPTYAQAVGAAAADEPGTRFVYDPVHFQAFGELMRRKLLTRGGGSPVDYLRTRVLDRIGVVVGNWRHGADGNPLLPAGAQLSAREWIKFGEFMRLEGKWNGVQIIPADLLRELRTPGPVNACYGLTWWLNHPVDAGTLANSVMPVAVKDGSIYPGGPTDIFLAGGFGEQRLYIIPHLGVVVARQAPVFNLADFSDEAFLKLLLPAIQPSTLLNVSTRAHAGTGESSLIAGFVINGVRPKWVLLRAAGPALTNFGVTTALTDPHLRLYNSSGKSVLENNDWGTSPDASRITAAFDAVGAFRFANGSKDAARLAMLSPGAYTAHVTPASGGPGVALVEVYEMPESFTP
jgi:CubicO group peptidase (beta-lactamase class C family)